jgi:hypothetical protein
MGRSSGAATANFHVKAFFTKVRSAYGPHLNLVLLTTTTMGRFVGVPIILISLPIHWGLRLRFGLRQRRDGLTPRSGGGKANHLFLGCLKLLDGCCIVASHL